LKSVVANDAELETKLLDSVDELLDEGPVMYFQSHNPTQFDAKMKAKAEERDVPFVVVDTVE
jgi:hypothetical protein